MPELPEVETIARDINNSNFINKTIDDVIIYYQKTILGSFTKNVKGKSILRVDRHGKYLIFVLNIGFIIGHLRMSGRMLETKALDPPLAHERFRLVFSQSAISFVDTRTFGRFGYYKTREEALSHLGEDGLTSVFNQKNISSKLHSSKRSIKSFLLDQKIIAGIGNIYADEILFEAKISPLRPCNTLQEFEVGNLLKAVKNVLQRGVENRGTSLGSGKGNYKGMTGKTGLMQNFLKVYQKKGLCSRCNKPLKKIIVAQRGTHYCPYCQK
jgi:formamidopyrimidine-DNA glycosylase